MTAAARKIDRGCNATFKPAARPSPLAVFELRAWARALLWQANELTLHEAVDVLQASAERDGLVELLGPDAVQGIMRTAFHAVRP